MTVTDEVGCSFSFSPLSLKPLLRTTANPPAGFGKGKRNWSLLLSPKGGGDRGARVCSLRPTSSEKGKKKKKKFSSSFSHIIPVSLFLETEPTPVGRSVCWPVAFRAVIPFFPSLASAESPSRRLFLPRGGVVARGGAPPLSLSFPLCCVSPARGREGKAYNFFLPSLPPAPERRENERLHLFYDFSLPIGRHQRHLLTTKQGIYWGYRIRNTEIAKNS